MARGWTIWVKDNDRRRVFSVAVSDRAQARDFLKERLPPHCVLISDQGIPAKVIAFLMLPDGKALEWMPLDPKDRIIPSGTLIR